MSDRTRPVTKAVIPAAGLGTRFLPATKAQQKAMLPLLEKPSIQYVVEEAVTAGITDIIVVTGRGGRSIADHFDRAPELEDLLERAGKVDALRNVRSLADMANLHFVRQGEARGLGHAVRCAEAFVGDDPFAVLLPDDLMIDDAALLTAMVSAYGEHGGSVVAFRDVPREEVSAYGVADVAEKVADNLYRLRRVVEKPAAADAPSTLIATGRYVFSPAIFDCIAKVEPGKGGEIQLTDAITMLAEEEPIFAIVFDEGRFDVGTPIEHLKATVELASRHPELGKEFRAFLAEFVQRSR
jgi:UTP--glucose-1-phosphate uridylyltransferase